MTHSNQRKRLELTPFLVAAFAYLAVLAAIALQIFRIDHFTQPYAVDDAYIHMAIAKDLVRYHVFGVTPFAFSSASSSILWPFLLAAIFLVTGVHLQAAFFLNIVLSLVLLWCANRWLWELGWKRPLPRALALTATGLLIPLAGMTVLGLEHVLQCLTALGLAAAAALYLGGDGDDGRPGIGRLAAWSLLATASRYEAMFEVSIICLLLVLCRSHRTERRRAAVWTAAAGAAPIVAFGIFGLAHGAHFFPNSLLLKTTPETPTLMNRVIPVITNLKYATTHGLLLAWIALAAGTAALWKRRELDAAFYLGLIAIGAGVLHLAFARMGQLMRYESYLTALAMLALFALFQSFRRGTARSPLLPYAMLFGVLVLVPRAYIGTAYAAPAVKSIYLQQYQLGRFFAQEYPATPIAMNDIGIISFMGHRHEMDAYGLASTQVLNLRLRHKYNPTAVDAIAKRDGVKVAAVYQGWFFQEYPVPARWRYAGSFTPECPGKHYTVGGNTVAFYAVDPAELPELKQKLADFSRELPPRTKLTQVADSTYCLP